MHSWNFLYRKVLALIKRGTLLKSNFLITLLNTNLLNFQIKHYKVEDKYKPIRMVVMVMYSNILYTKNSVQNK